MSAPDTRSGERTRASCCCPCDEPAHKRSTHAERCHRCGKHRPPNGRIRWVSEDWTPEPHASRDGEGERAFVVNRVAHFITTRLGFEYDDPRVIAVARRIVDDVRALPSHVQEGEILDLAARLAHQGDAG